MIWFVVVVFFCNKIGRFKNAASFYATDYRKYFCFSIRFSQKVVIYTNTKI